MEFKFGSLFVGMQSVLHAVPGRVVQACVGCGRATTSFSARLFVQDLCAEQERFKGAVHGHAQVQHVFAVLHRTGGGTRRTAMTELRQDFERNLKFSGKV